jgi:hypothetical protein
VIRGREIGADHPILIIRSRDYSLTDRPFCLREQQL